MSSNDKRNTGGWVNSRAKKALECQKRVDKAMGLLFGYCMEPSKQECDTQFNSCLACRNFCTTPDFAPPYSEFRKQRP